MTGRSLHGFCDDHWRGLNLWNRDLDHLAPEVVLETLAKRTGTPTNQVQATTLNAFEGTLVPRVVPNGSTAMVRPIGVWHRERKTHGLQYCSHCLTEDQIPYFKTLWRLLPVSTCTRHGVILKSSCPRCDAPVAPHRGDFLICHHCGSDLRGQKHEPANSNVLQFQHHLQGVLAGNPVCWPGFHGTYPIAFFALINRLVLLLSTGARRDRLLKILQARCDIEGITEFTSKTKDTKTLSPRSVHDVMIGITYLLRGWPWIFIATFLDAKVYWSWAMKDLKPQNAPYVFFQPTKAFLQIDPNAKDR